MHNDETSKRIAAEILARTRLSSRRANRAEKSGKGPSDRANEIGAQAESLKEQARTIHEEARMVLPGIQVLFGFQLIAVFNRPFFDLDALDRVVHLGSLLLVAVSIGLIMAPAAYHRLAEAGRVSSHWVKLASRYIACAMGALMLAIGIDIYIVTIMIVGSPSIGIAMGALTACLLGWLWFGIPLLRRSGEAGE